jgi:hypothetical protein
MSGEVKKDGTMAVLLGILKELTYDDFLLAAAAEMRKEMADDSSELKEAITLEYWELELNRPETEKLAKQAAAETSIAECDGFKNYGDGCGGLHSTEYYTYRILRPENFPQIVAAALCLAEKPYLLGSDIEQKEKIAMNICRYINFRRKQMSEKKLKYIDRY